MPETSIHQGQYEAIPSDATPGLVFLKTLLPELDSLGPFDGEPKLAQLFAPDATFTLGNGQPSKASEVVAMIPQRASMLSKFSRDFKAVWDIALPSGKRTVLYQSTSKSTFKGDTEQKEVAVEEFNIVELGPGPSGGLVLLNAHTYMDPSPVMERMQLFK